MVNIKHSERVVYVDKMQASTKHVYIYKYNVLVLKMNQDSYEEMIWIK